MSHLISSFGRVTPCYRVSKDKFRNLSRWLITHTFHPVVCLSHPSHKVKSGDHCAELVNFKFLAVMGLFWQVMASPPHQTCVKLASFGKTTLAQLNSDLSRKLGEMKGGIRENLNSSHHSSHPQSQTYLSPKTFITKWASELSIYPTRAINIRTPTYQLYVWLRCSSVDTIMLCLFISLKILWGEKNVFGI